MIDRSTRLVFACVLGLCLSIIPKVTSAGDDAKTPAKDPPAKLPDYSKYTFVKEMTGEVIRADEKKITLCVKVLVSKRGAESPFSTN